MTKLPCLSALSLLALSLPALAEDAPFAFVYDAFEAGVTHVDLAACPAELAGEGRICRATVVNDQINVFVFSDQGEKPLVAFKSWPADLLNGLMD